MVDPGSYSSFGGFSKNNGSGSTAAPGALFQRQVEEGDIGDVKMCNITLLSAIAKGDWITYEHLVDDGLTCFEPEACGHLVVGTDFHRYYFRRHKEASASSETNVTMVDENVRVVGDVAVMAYVRLQQHDGKTSRFEETRIWQRKPDHAGATTPSGKWKLIHFHRSDPKASY